MKHAFGVGQNIGGLRRVSGATPIGAGTVPGVGSMLGCWVSDGVTYAARSDGTAPVVYRADGSNWVRTDLTVDAFKDL